MHVRIKICGVRRAAEVHAVAEAGADAVGLNFVPQSVRYIGSLQAARALARECQQSSALRWAGIFVNPSLAEVLELAAAVPLQIVQLHGDEPPEFVDQLKARLLMAMPQCQVWKAQRVASRADLLLLGRYRCDAWLLDAKVPGVRGGGGKTFDWQVLSGFKREVPLVLSGGLNPTNVAQAIATVKPEWVDVASGVESAPGSKEAALISAFVKAARMKAP